MIHLLRDNAMGFYKTAWTVYLNTYMNVNIKVFFPDLVRTALSIDLDEKACFFTIFCLLGGFSGYFLCRTT